MLCSKESSNGYNNLDFESPSREEAALFEWTVEIWSSCGPRNCSENRANPKELRALSQHGIPRTVT